MTYTLKKPTVEAAYVAAVRDGENVPQWFLKEVFAGRIKTGEKKGTFDINGLTAVYSDVILLHPDGRLTVLSENQFWQLYEQLPEHARAA